MPSTMDSTSEARINEIKSVLRSLLISNLKLDVTVQRLNSLYKEVEGRYIPYHEFHFATLEEFLLHLPDTVQLQYNHQNKLCVYHVNTEKSAHISSLVARQRKPIMKKSKSLYQFKPRHYPQNYYKAPQSYSYSPATTNTILQALQELKNNSNYARKPYGLRKSDVLTKVKDKLGRYTSYTIQNLNSHLFQLSHLLVVEGDFIYFKEDFGKSQENVRAEKPTPYNNNSKPINYTNNNGYGNSDYKNVAKEFSNPKTSNVQKETANHIQSNTSLQESTNHTQNNYVHKETANQSKDNNVNNKSIQQIHDELSDNNNGNGVSSISVNNEFNEKSQPKETNSNDVIKERTKIRLQKLIEKHPEGIWCAELPDLYKHEYNVALDYEDAGFNSITEFVAALPDIFCIVEPIPNTNRQMLLDAKNPEGKPNSIQQTKTLASLYNFDEYVAGDPEPIPFKLSSNVSEKLVPDGVMSYNETVDQIRVSSLVQDDYIEVVISEIFTPSFFWVHLRKYKKKLKGLMDNLDDFYTSTDLDQYKIPQILLQPGLNIACIYAKMWHRGIIKKIKPDGYIVILFYDYGTVKTYHPDDLYFLNKKFSYLPAQAIACGLYNIKPIEGNVEWPQAATDEFNHRIWNVPLVAFICNTNEENNTMTVTLIDTSDDLTDFHVTDWMVENEFAQHGKMVEVPFSLLLKYDEDVIIRGRQDQAKSKKDKEVVTNVVADVSVIDTRESQVASPNPSSNYIDSTYDATHVATLVKENMDLTKQTNTIAQAILLNMPINRVGDFTDSNLDRRNVKVENKESESQESSDDAFNPDKLNDKFAQDLKNSLSTIKVNISEMNNNYYGSEFVKNDSMQFKLPLKEVMDNKSVRSLFSNTSKCEFKKESSNIIRSENESERKESINVNNQRRPSTQSTNSYQSNSNYQVLQEDTCDEDEELRCNGSVELDRITIKSGTITLEKVETRENPKIYPIKVKYPTKFAESYFNEDIQNQPQNVNNSETCNGSSNHQEEDEGYASKHSSSHTTSNLTSTSPITNINATTTGDTSAFTVIYLSEKCKKKPIHIFHLDNEGWVCTTEFVDAFTNLKDQRVMLKLLQILEYNVNFKNLLRDTHSDLFARLDNSALKVRRDENNKIIEDFVLILLPLKSMLQVLVKLDFLNSKILKEAIHMMKQSRENMEQVLYELFNNRILFDALNLLFQYKQFKRTIRLRH